MQGMLIEHIKPVVGLPPGTPSSSTPDYVSMKQYDRVCIVIMVDNAATVTGSAITVHQATSAAGANEKAVPFTKAWRNVDLAVDDALAEFAVTGNTFTTDTTDAKNLIYVIEVSEQNLDFQNGFHWIRAGTGDAVSTAVAVLYLLYGAGYRAPAPSMRTAVA